MNNNFVNINITDEKSLLNATDILHDGYCNLSTIKYDKNTGIWKAIFEREFFEDPELMESKSKFLFFDRVSFPMAKSEFTLERIKEYRIEGDDTMQYYSFNECLVKDNIYRFDFHEGMEMVFKFADTPKGSLTDKELLDKKGSFYVRRNRNPFKK